MSDARRSRSDASESASSASAAGCLPALIAFLIVMLVAAGMAILWDQIEFLQQLPRAVSMVIQGVVYGTMYFLLVKAMRRRRGHRG